MRNGQITTTKKIDDKTLTALTSMRENINAWLSVYMVNYECNIIVNSIKRRLTIELIYSHAKTNIKHDFPIHEFRDLFRNELASNFKLFIPESSIRINGNVRRKMIHFLMISDDMTELV